MGTAAHSSRTPPSGATRSRYDLATLGKVALILIAVWAIYSPVLRGGWLWDDEAELVQNPEVSGAGGLAKIWFQPSHADYFPLKSTVQWIGWRLWQDNVVGYHALNLALHALSALLVWSLFRRLGLRLAWLGGLLFAVHPVAVESVAWIAELKNTLSLPLLLLAMCAYLDYDEGGRRSRYWAALGWFLASLLCKTSGVMLPVVFLLYHLWKTGRITLGNIRTVAAFFAVSLVLGLVTIHFQDQRAIGSAELPVTGLASRVANAAHVIFFYLGKIFVPVHLMPIYPQWGTEPVAAGDFLPLLGLVALAAACWYRRLGWGRHGLFGVGAFIALLAPVLGFVPMVYHRLSWVADHFVYLPMLGLVALAVGGIDWGLARIGKQGERVAHAALLALAFAFGAMSRDYAKIFRDDEVLWTYTLRHNPGAWMAENNLGLGLHHAGKYAEAIARFRTSIKLYPRFAEARMNLANSLMQTGSGEEAISEYREAIRLKPSFAEAYNNLGSALFLSGQAPEALAAYRKALELRPDYADVHNNLGKISMRTGDFAAAAGHYEKAVEFAPESPVYRNDLGYALVRAGRLDPAAVQFEAALKLKPDYVDALTNLGAVFHQRGDLARATQLYEAALRLDPQAANAQKNLALIRAGRN